MATLNIGWRSIQHENWTSYWKDFPKIGSSLPITIRINHHLEKGDFYLVLISFLDESKKGQMLQLPLMNQEQVEQFVSLYEEISNY